MIEKFMSQMLTKENEAINPFLIILIETTVPRFTKQVVSWIFLSTNGMLHVTKKKHVFYWSRESVWQSSKESILVDYDEEIMSHKYIISTVVLDKIARLMEAEV